MGGANRTRCAGFPHFGHFWRAGALKLSRFSYWLPQLSQRYAYVGKFVPSNEADVRKV